MSDKYVWRDYMAVQYKFDSKCIPCYLNLFQKSNPWSLLLVVLREVNRELIAYITTATKCTSTYLLSHDTQTKTNVRSPWSHELHSGFHGAVIYEVQVSIPGQVNIELTYFVLSPVFLCVCRTSLLPISIAQVL